MDTKLTKKALRTPGQFAYDLFMKKYKGQPLKQIYNPDLRARVNTVLASGHGLSDALKNEIALDTSSVRTQQGEAARLLTNILLTASAFGGGIGLVRHLPKWLEAKRDINKYRYDEDKNALEDVEKSSSDSTWLKDKLKSLGRGIEGATTAAPIKSPMDVPVGPIPRGGMIPLGLGTALVGTIGADKLVDFITDRLRAKMIAKRKKKLKDEFQELLSPTSIKVSSLNGLIEDMASDYEGIEKQSIDLTSTSIGTLLTAALLLGIGGFAGGYGMGKKSPAAVRKKALELAIKRKLARRPVSLQLDPNMPIGAAPIRTSYLSGEHRVPLALPETTDKKKEEDEAFDLSKLGSVKVAKPLYEGVETAPAPTTVSVPGDSPRGLSGLHKRWENLNEGARTVERLKPLIDKIDADKLGKNIEAFQGMDMDQISKLLASASKLQDMFGKFQKGWEGFKGGFGSTIKNVGRFLLGTIPGMASRGAQNISTALASPQTNIPPSQAGTAQTVAAPKQPAPAPAPDSDVAQSSAPAPKPSVVADNAMIAARNAARSATRVV